MFCIFFKENIRSLCRTLTEVTSKICPPLATQAIKVQEKFEMLFSLFAVCHFKYNSRKPIDDEALDIFGSYFLPSFEIHKY